ncbi:putative membrane protein [Sulfurospirillum multivorans DSM 12446]|uniref:Membrane protein n=1 Tax=Sulfurospirillum multivorans (strain DM 12446 / JCM 15788 / NBRC 109480) TaxID=1150621 RepID=A0AA86E451_SULMK|nr:putative membrane protein [Sulfurospirillum multivorans DSM 12446]
MGICKWLFLSNKFGFLAGIIMIVLSAIGFIALFSAYYFNLLNSKNPIPFIVIGLIMVSAITLSNFFYKAKKEVLSANENHNDSFLPITGFDTVNDTVYSSIDGNIYHSGN